MVGTASSRTQRGEFTFAGRRHGARKETLELSGRFTTWFGGNGLLNEDGTASGKAQTALTFDGRGTNADGSTFSFHQNGNTVFDPNGLPKVDVFHDMVNCR